MDIQTIATLVLCPSSPAAASYLLGPLLHGPPALPHPPPPSPLHFQQCLCLPPENSPCLLFPLSVPSNREAKISPIPWLLHNRPSNPESSVITMAIRQNGILRVCPPAASGTPALRACPDSNSGCLALCGGVLSPGLPSCVHFWRHSQPNCPYSISPAPCTSGYLSSSEASEYSWEDDILSRAAQTPYASGFPPREQRQAGEKENILHGGLLMNTHSLHCSRIPKPFFFFPCLLANLLENSVLQEYCSGASQNCFFWIALSVRASASLRHWTRNRQTELLDPWREVTWSTLPLWQLTAQIRLGLLLTSWLVFYILDTGNPGGFFVCLFVSLLQLL